jgi:hypothetical protein
MQGEGRKLKTLKAMYKTTRNDYHLDCRFLIGDFRLLVEDWSTASPKWFMDQEKPSFLFPYTRTQSLKFNLFPCGFQISDLL